MLVQEFAAGAGQSIVVYVSDDVSDEVAAADLYRQIAIDSARRAQHGSRIISMSSFPVDQSAAAVASRDGGQQSKLAVAVVYAVP